MEMEHDYVTMLDRLVDHIYEPLIKNARKMFGIESREVKLAFEHLVKLDEFHKRFREDMYSNSTELDDVLRIFESSIETIDDLYCNYLANFSSLLDKVALWLQYCKPPNSFHNFLKNQMKLKFDGSVGELAFYLSRPLTHPQIYLNILRYESRMIMTSNYDHQADIDINGNLSAQSASTSNVNNDSSNASDTTNANSNTNGSKNNNDHDNDVVAYMEVASVIRERKAKLERIMNAFAQILQRHSKAMENNSTFMLDKAEKLSVELEINGTANNLDTMNERRKYLFRSNKFIIKRLNRSKDVAFYVFNDLIVWVYESKNRYGGCFPLYSVIKIELIDEKNPIATNECGFKIISQDPDANTIDTFYCNKSDDPNENKKARQSFVDEINKLIQDLDEDDEIPVIKSRQLNTTETYDNPESKDGAQTEVKEDELKEHEDLKNSDDTDTDAYDSRSKDEYIRKRWKIGEIIGNGSFGAVHKAVNVYRNTTVAAKFAIKNTSSLQDEAEILLQLKWLKHPNVIQFFEYIDKYQYTTQNGEKYETVLIIMEYASNGQLFDILKYSGALSNDIAKFYFEQIISALKLFHGQNIVHRDLKPENILLDDNFNIKICDFGLSTEIDIENDESMKGTAGTRGYMAPEILEKKDYNAKCDIFSAGVILFIMLTARPPFSHATKTDKKYGLIVNGKYKQFWNIHCNKEKYEYTVNDDDAKDLIEKMLCYDPTKRISLELIANHPWMKTSNNNTKNTVKSIMSQKYKEAIEKKEADNAEKGKNVQKEDRFEIALSTFGTQIGLGVGHKSSKNSKNKPQIGLGLLKIDETKEESLNQLPTTASTIEQKISIKPSHLSQLQSSQLTAETSSQIQLSYSMRP